MKTVSAGLKTHLGGELTKLAVCLKMTRTDSVVIAATNHDTDLTVSSVLYKASAGGTETDVQTSNALSVDTVDQMGILSSDSITDADIHAGLYDYAAIKLFAVNWSDLTMGSYSLRDGTIGQVTIERDQFTAQLQGMMDAFKRSMGELVNPSCPYNLGDLPFPAPTRGRCTKDLTTFTKTGTLTGVSADGLTLFDTARTEPGPAGGIAITGITNANPGVVTTASPLGLPDLSTVTISGVVGATWANTVTVIHNPSGSTFELSIDTSDTGAYPPRTSGGIVTPLGADSGYFDYGWCKITSGANNGITREVKAYIPGQWTLQDSFPYTLTGSETYTMAAGCNKTFAACKTKFSNGDNFGGFPYVPGQDKGIQVAQPQSKQSSGKK